MNHIIVYYATAAFLAVNIFLSIAFIFYRKRRTTDKPKEPYALQKPQTIPTLTALQNKQHITGKANYITYIKLLSSGSKRKRKKAAISLRRFPESAVKNALVYALSRERYNSVKLYIVHALTYIGDPATLPAIIDQLPQAPEFFHTRFQAMLVEQAGALYSFFPVLKDRKEPQIQQLLLELARVYPAKDLSLYVQHLYQQGGPEIARTAFDVLSTTYPSTIDVRRAIGNKDRVIQNKAVAFLARKGQQEDLPIILMLLKTKSLREEAISALDTIVRKSPLLTPTLILRYSVEENQQIKSGILTVLADHIALFLARSELQGTNELREFLQDVYLSGNAAGFINFLISNNNITIENIVVNAIKPILSENRESLKLLSASLPRRIRNKLNIQENEQKKVKRSHKSETGKNIFLIICFLTAFSAIPLLFLVSGAGNFQEYIRFFNYAFGFYTVLLNSTYLVMLAFSSIGIFVQSELWKIKPKDFLYHQKILPSISIIAPAFNEESTIIENANSLLALDYPDYEVIIVNDGSTDRTLEKLVRYFELERKKITCPGSLETQEVLGIYQSPRAPGLVVIDKQNGGKADSLNAGINYSSNEYFASIDADSILEQSALLKIASGILDEENEVVAAGGNILPVNGCTVKRGYIKEKHVPKTFLAKLQTVEYLRSFIAGRVGWSVIKGLTIISGAFGLFKRERVMEFHGYLTSVEQYKKDTVGEDMEIVVRLARRMRDFQRKFRIIYQYNANCWTEVPERFHTLSRQRDRWQRGLIDIIVFHFSIFLNPRHKTRGMISFPYFVLFEIIGPWIELQGFVLFFTAIAFGLMTPGLFLFLFTASVLLGTMTTLTSLLLSEKESGFENQSDEVLILLYAFIEGFGMRQLLSITRIYGFLSSFFKNRGWGQMTRKGFTENNSKAEDQEPSIEYIESPEE
ncbi:MAG: glycosyltransferase [Spirochaetia bacterium]